MFLHCSKDFKKSLAASDVIFPKLIVTCRREFLATLANYQRFFHVEQASFNFSCLVFFLCVCVRFALSRQVLGECVSFCRDHLLQQCLLPYFCEVEVQVLLALCHGVANSCLLDRNVLSCHQSVNLHFHWFLQKGRLQIAGSPGTLLFPRGCEVWSAGTKSFLGDLSRAMRMFTC